MKLSLTPLIIVLLSCGFGILNEASSKLELIPMPPTWDQLEHPDKAEIAIAYGKKIPSHRWNHETLSLVPGISDRLAQRILSAAKKEGTTIDPCRLERVRGIGPNLAKRIRWFLWAGESCPPPS